MTNVFLTLLTAVTAFAFASCSNDLDIQQSYPFTVEIMPVPKRVVLGETVEIRCTLNKEGEYDNTYYTIRYFQYDGEGTLKMDTGIVLTPNDRYLLESDTFRLYYTSACSVSQNFIIVVEDNFGNSFELEFTFNNDSDSSNDADDEGNNTDNVNDSTGGNDERGTTTTGGEDDNNGDDANNSNGTDGSGIMSQFDGGLLFQEQDVICQ